jgi:hypothetical protein
LNARKISHPINENRGLFRETFLESYKRDTKIWNAILRLFYVKDVAECRDCFYTEAFVENIDFLEGEPCDLGAKNYKNGKEIVARKSI